MPARFGSDSATREAATTTASPAYQEATKYGEGWIVHDNLAHLKTSNNISILLNFPGSKFESDKHSTHTTAYAGLALDMSCGLVHPEAARLLQYRKDLEDLSRATDYPSLPSISGLGEGLAPLPYQRAGIAYALRQRRVILGDEMGLGKTVQAIIAIQAARAFPALVIVPASLRRNWGREFAKWLPVSTQVVVEPGKGLPRPAAGTSGPDVVIMSYEAATSHKAALVAPRTPWKALVLDECQYAKNPKSLRSKTIHAIAQRALTPNALVLLLSGTAIMNRPVELISQLQVFDPSMSSFGSAWKFTMRYCDPKQSRWGWDTTGAANLDELNKVLRQNWMVRRLKKAVLKDLPDKTRNVVMLELEGEEAAIYQEAERDAIAYLLKRREELTGEEADWKARMRAEAGKAFTIIEGLKQASADAKFPLAVEWIDEFLESTERKLVIFVSHRRIAKALIEKYGAVYITGDAGPAARQAAIDSFQEDPNTRVIVCSLQAGGVGITLTAASDVLTLELGWTDAAHQQAEDRCHRIGQKSGVIATYLLAAGSVDERIWGILQRKRDIATQALDGNVALVNDGSVLGDLIVELVS